MHAADEAALLEQICTIVIEDCGHAMVWIGFAEEDEGKTVRPVAHAGFDDGYLQTLGITWADTERGLGPYRRGHPQRAAMLVPEHVDGPPVRALASRSTQTRICFLPGAAA